MAIRKKLKSTKASPAHFGTKYQTKGSLGQNRIKVMYRRHVPGVMNGTEEKFACYLSSLIQTEEVIRWEFESHTLRLAPKTTYTPDFYVIMKDGSIRFYEVKGFWTSAARIKTKMAAFLYPQYKFVAAQLKRGEWKYEEFNP